MPKKHTSRPQTVAKLSLTLTPDAADRVRALADEHGLTLAQVVRKALGLYQFMQSLSDNEELCIRDKESGEITRLAVLDS